MVENIYKYNFEPISTKLTRFEESLSRLEQIRYIEQPHKFHKETAYFKKVDGKISYYYMFSRIKSRNYINGSGYLTHGFDFYKGNFHGQMIRGLINCCNLKKDSMILDPFCGSGTVLIEAMLLGFNSIGIDINPIACLNTKIKTRLLDTPVNYLICDNKKYFNLEDNQENFTINNNFNNFLNNDIKELFYTFLFTRVISDEVYISKDRIKSFNENYQKYIKVLKLFENLKEKLNLSLGKTEVYFNDAIIKLKKFNPNSIDAVITSPPYIDLIDYIQNDYFQIKYIFNHKLIGDLKKESLGCKFESLKLTEDLFWYKMDKIFKNIFRILKLNSYFILVIGNYRNMREKFIILAKKNAFFIEMILEREVINQKNYKNTEYVIFLKKKMI